jgi:hypothetical protein
MPEKSPGGFAAGKPCCAFGALAKTEEKKGKVE